VGSGAPFSSTLDCAWAPPESSRKEDPLIDTTRSEEAVAIRNLYVGLDDLPRFERRDGFHLDPSHFCGTDCGEHGSLRASSAVDKLNGK